MTKRQKLALSIILGVFGGVGLFTFHYAEGLSYFSPDPKACVNCHIMQSQFDSWQKSSHHTSATCVDCHLPHALVPKLLAKADNGYRHSKGFTFQDFHEPILISRHNGRILQDNCLRCHDALVHELSGVWGDSSKTVSCVHCHSGVGHGERTGMGRLDERILAQGDK